MHVPEIELFFHLNLNAEIYFKCLTVKQYVPAAVESAAIC